MLSECNEEWRDNIIKSIDEEIHIKVSHAISSRIHWAFRGNKTAEDYRFDLIKDLTSIMERLINENLNRFEKTTQAHAQGVQRVYDEFRVLKLKVDSLHNGVEKVGEPPELHDCPMCGNDDPEINEDIHASYTKYQIICDDCELTTTWFDEKIPLIEYWNDRQ